MKNENKFIVKSAKKAVLRISSLFILSIIFANNGIMMVNASNEVMVKQVTSEESVFDTNSTDNVINRHIPNGYSAKLNTKKQKGKLDETVCQEITNRIDVCKANTAVSKTSDNISDLVADIEKSKQQKDCEAKKKRQEAAEIAVCRAASKNVPNDEPGCRSHVKTYMAYTAVTSKNSNQYKFLYSDKCYTDPKTGLRMSDGRYCIAVGTGYCSKIGTKINLVLEDGSIIKCILGDVKSDAHTDSSHRYHAIDGSVAEFIVDYSIFNDLKDETGSVNWVEGLDGKIEKVVVLDE